MPDTLAGMARDLQLHLLSIAWVPAASAGFFGALGYASRHVLLGLPDFPEKPAMLRGATWSGPAVAALAALMFGTVWFGLGLGFTISGICLGKAVFWSGFAVSWYRFRPETDGMFAGGNYWLRYRHKGVEKWLEDWRKARQKAARYDRILAFYWPVMIAFWLGVGVWGYCTFDRSFRARMAEERLGATLRQKLNDPRVVEVLPMHLSFEGPLYPMVVHVAPGSTAQQGAQLAERMRQVLAARDDRRPWRIRVRPKYGHMLAQVICVPPGVVLPEGIEKMHPRPRKW